jgi:hypothetical protein
VTSSMTLPCLIARTTQSLAHNLCSSLFDQQATSQQAQHRELAWLKGSFFMLVSAACSMKRTLAMKRMDISRELS